MAKNLKTYTVAVVGCGFIGAGVEYFAPEVQPGTHAGAFSENERTELVALVEQSDELRAKAERNFPGAATYTSIEELFAVTVPDVVVIATPTTTHRDLVLACAARNVPLVLCEKPVAESVEDGIAMVKACEGAGSKLLVNYQRHSDVLVQKWYKRFKEGLLGTLRQGTVYYYNGVANNAGHTLELLNLFLGEPLEVMARWNPSTETEGKGPNADGYMLYPGDVFVALQSLPPFYGEFTLSLFGDDGALDILRPTTPEIRYRKKIPHKEVKGYWQLSDDEVIEGGTRSALAPVADQVVAVLDGEDIPVCTGSDGVAVMRVLEALKKSADTGKVVKLYE